MLQHRYNLSVNTKNGISRAEKATCGNEEDMRELSTAEWHVMESLWAGSPKVGSRIVADLKESVGWSRSTTLTMLRRMSDKGLILCEEGEDMKMYRPMLERREAVQKETQSFLDRVYLGSLSMLVNHFVEKDSLSREEIDELRRILDRVEEK